MANVYWLGAGGTAGDYSVAANWSGGGTPLATDNVWISKHSTQAITAGLAQSGVALADFRVERGFTQAIGVAPTNSATPTYLDIDPNMVEFAGGGVTFLDVHSASSPDVVVTHTGSAQQGKHGLYLLGTMTELSVTGGNVGVAAFGGESAVITTATVSNNAKLAIYDGGQVTTARCFGGELYLEDGVTTLEVYNGTVTLAGDQAFSTITMYGGTVIWNSNNNITTLNIKGGTFVSTGVNLARTISTLNLDGGNGSAEIDEDYTTVSTLAINGGRPVRLTVADL